MVRNTGRYQKGFETRHDHDYGDRSIQWRRVSVCGLTHSL